MQGKRIVGRAGHLQVRRVATGFRWHAVWRDADGHHRKVLGPAHVKPTGKRTAKGAIVFRAADGTKPDGYLTRREAEDELRAILEGAPAAPIAGSRTYTFGDAADRWLARGTLKPSTLVDYRQAIDAYLRPQLGSVALGELTVENVRKCVDPFKATRTGQKVRMIARAVLAHAVSEERVRINVADKIPALRLDYRGRDIDCFDREELEALLRAAREGPHRKRSASRYRQGPGWEAIRRQQGEQNEQDAAIYLTAALTGLRRGELIALRWRDVDFGGSVIRVRHTYGHGSLTAPKSGKVRSVPMIDEVAVALARLGQRGHSTTLDDQVFPGTNGVYLDASALGKRYRAAIEQAGIRSLPFHSLRHHFGSVAINVLSPTEVQAMLGHSDLSTTARYLHAKARPEDATRLAAAFSRSSTSAQATRDETASRA